MEKKQFDEFLGGTVQLPRDVQIVGLAAARASEIAAMTYSIENPQQTKLVFQKLPVHMRRRVMSHNAKRMPRRLREAHLKQMAKSGMPPEGKRPSRKYRRRGRNLWEERDSQRRGRCKWLETHLWHAKRFRMIEKWGWKIGESPNGKGFRACYRAAAEHCLLQDVSYYNCLEIRGPEMLVRQRLEEHCDRKNLTFGAKIYRAGGREGNVMFFERNRCPRSPIGRVNFLWKPGEETGQGVVWIWSHPLVFERLCEEIMRSFEFRPSEDTAEKRIEGKSLIRSYENEENCLMTDLSDSLNRFRLTGPLTLAVLTDALRPPNLSSADEKHREKTVSCMEAESEDSKVQESTNKWYETFYQDSENLRSLDVQRECMETLRTLKSPGQLPPNSIMAMTVLDPRFFLPAKRTKIFPNTEYYVKMTLPKSLADRSPLWNPEVRELVKESRRVANNVDKLRGDNLVPGVENDDRFNENVIAKIPIILVQNPGCNDPRKSVGFASGLDVIIPAGWSMPFWQSFVLRCARAGGLGESRLMAFEKLDVDSPESQQPDVPAYEAEALATMASLRAKYFRYPPNRRVNFTKLSITSPFHCEWGTLTREWTSDRDKFCVMRDRGSLEMIGEALSRLSNRGTRKRSIDAVKGIEFSSASLNETIFTDLNRLVPVKIAIEGKGRPRNFAIICVPTSQDLTTRESKKNWSGPVQKLAIDPNERQRRELRNKHRTLLKRCNRRARQSRMLAREAAIAASTLVSKRKKRLGAGDSIDRNFAIKREYREKMEELYLPKCERVRSSCDREIMGYVVRGDFSFSEARGIGIGYVTLNSLRTIVDSRVNLILVRNTQTRQYRFARISVLDPYRRFAS